MVPPGFLGILVSPGLFDFMPKWNEHKAKPWSSFWDFSWPKIIIFYMVTLLEEEKGGNTLSFPVIVPGIIWTMSSWVWSQRREQLLARFLWEFWNSVCQQESEFLRGKVGLAPQITSGKFPTFLTPAWLLAPTHQTFPTALWWWTDINSSWFSREYRNKCHLKSSHYCWQDEGNDFQLKGNKLRWDIGNKLFILRVVRAWHKFPSEVVDVPFSRVW